jgi:hypothetical protein
MALFMSFHGVNSLLRGLIILKNLRKSLLSISKDEKYLFFNDNFNIMTTNHIIFIDANFFF